MKLPLSYFYLLAFTLPLIAAKPTTTPRKDELIVALTIITGEFGERPTMTYHEALKVLASYLKSSEAKAVQVPDAAIAWIPRSGPCDPAVLEAGFLASLAKDHLTGTSEGRIHRAWLAAIRLYQLLRAVPENKYPEIPALEAMIAKEARSALRPEALAIETAKPPNKAPEPTTGAVTPRAIEGTSK